ncbi:hypothetical protein ANANG_G00199490 [Anguilla anguilla]|uniref:COMM domain-containing protein n=1 Tax=Anguilla anguilla TaxID=7936 RepID=A0A9D3RTL7_ANGAN|nr:hypothetical protein ANANG_G00199490 [Anguilla anguilla]
MASIIKETPSIKEAVTHINAIDINKFSRLLSRILQKLHLKAERSFSEEEEEKLQSALSLDKQALGLVLETISFILEQVSGPRRGGGALPPRESLRVPALPPALQKPGGL